MRITEGDVKPAPSRFVTTTSRGQGAFFALVIIAITVWPDFAPNSPLPESTSAGLLFVREESVNGKGTTTTSIGSAFLTLISPLEISKAMGIPCLQREFTTDRFKNRCLIFFCKFTDRSLHITPHFITVILALPVLPINHEIIR
jgi:hypothetical protein